MPINPTQPGHLEHTGVMFEPGAGSNTRALRGAAVTDLSRLALGQIYRWRPPKDLRPVALDERSITVGLGTRPPVSLNAAATKVARPPEQLYRWLVSGVPPLDSRAVSDHVMFALSRTRRPNITGGARAAAGHDARRR